MSWFSRKEEPDGLVMQDDEPHASYPDMPEPQGFDSNTLCRACSGGEGDGICAYHHSKAQRMIRRSEHIYGSR